MNSLVNRKIGKIDVISRAGSTRSGSIRWNCQCGYCGNFFTASSDHLTRKINPIKSCGCLHRRQGADNPLWRGHGDITGNWWSTRILRERRSGDRVKVPVTITIEYAWKLYQKQNRKCALSDLPIIINDSNEGTASLDRIDNSKGYIPGNIQWVHKDINFMKRNYDQEYFVQLCMAVADHSGW